MTESWTKTLGAEGVVALNLCTAVDFDNIVYCTFVPTPVVHTPRARSVITPAYISARSPSLDY